MTDIPTDFPAPESDAVSECADAAAEPLCVNDPANPACARRMIAVDKLIAHPGNVREDLDLSTEFCASIAENGVRVPLLITTGADGNSRVIEGHRRLAAAVKAGLATIPYDLDSERAGDEAGQYLDMVTANSGAYRKNFTPLEEATALFAAHEAGATRTRIRKATGRKADQVKTALAAGGLSADTREQISGLDPQLTLDDWLCWPSSRATRTPSNSSSWRWTTGIRWSMWPSGSAWNRPRRLSMSACGPSWKRSAARSLLRSCQVRRC